MSYLRQQHATGATLLSDQCKIHGDWKTKRNCISTVIATNCTSSYKSYRMYHLHSLRWQWLIILRLYSYLLALDFGTRYLFGILKPPHVDVDASFWCHFKMWCDNTRPYYFFVLHSWRVNRSISSWRSRTTLVLVRKNTNNKSTEANKETKVKSKKSLHQL